MTTRRLFNMMCPKRQIRCRYLLSNNSKTDWKKFTKLMQEVFSALKRRKKFPLPLTTFQRFIWAIGAVDVVVAHEVLGDALPVLAHELSLCVAGVVGVHCKWRTEQIGVAQPFPLAFCYFSLFLNLTCPTYCSRLWRFRRHHLDSPCLRRTSNAVARTCVSRGTGRLPDCRSWILGQQESYKKAANQKKKLVGNLHVRSRVAHHVLQFWSSSEPSPQSSAPSHTQWVEMQWWLLHSNWLDVQNLSAGNKYMELGGGAMQFQEHLCQKKVSQQTDRSESRRLRSHSRSPYHRSSSWGYSDRWGKRRSWLGIWVSSCL